MDTTFSNYQGHPPDDTWPGKTFMNYFTLAVSLIVVAIPVGFVLLHFALCADVYLDARERARRRDEVRAGQAQRQSGGGREQDLERNGDGDGDPRRRDWHHWFGTDATESSRLLPSVYEGASSDAD
ncbi:hypothetical protein PG996_005143 [Apiospora saccharicola]|uniref:Uncharacterized protein n=1 Tax=Apiospora saccharicola TaxID=335842 RepID=A0ABR1VNL3_9PEZI